MVSDSGLNPDWFGTAPLVVKEDKPVKIRFGDWFDNALGIKHRAKLLAKEKGY